MRDSALIYRSFYDAIKELEPLDQATLWNAIIEYALDKKEPILTGICKTVFTLIKPQLDANLRRFENGKQPKQKQNVSKTEANNKQNVSKHEANNNNNNNNNNNLNNNKNNNIPTLQDVKSYFAEKGYSDDVAERAYEFYSVADWHDSKGKKVRNWKQKMQSVWFKDENKVQVKKQLVTEQNPELNEW